MKKYGYCRISTRTQSIERQVRNIREKYPDAVIVQEVYTGTSQNRARWMNLTKNLKEGDTVIFDSLSRMSRNAEEGFADYEMLFNRGVELIFMKEPHINTAVYRSALSSSVPLTGGSVDVILEGVNKYLLILAKAQIKLAFAQSEKEVSDLRQRTREGMETARLNGKRIGQRKGSRLTTKKSIAAKEVIRKMSKDFNGTLSDVDVIKLCGITHNTYYKYKRELLPEIID